MAKIITGRFYGGTSNITLPGNKTTFPEGFQNQTRLHYYASLFNSLEVNASFYKVPMARTFARWATEVGDDFRFTIKLWKGVTHNKGLTFKRQDVDGFMDAISNCGINLGPLLIQLPKSTKAENIDALTELLVHIKTTGPGKNLQIAVEFRDPCWYRTTVLKLLDKYRASLVQHDMPGSEPGVINAKAEFIVLRFHGEKGDYKGTYDPGILHKKAVEVSEWLKQGKDVFVYFNNTIGSAYQDSIDFRKIVTSLSN